MGLREYHRKRDFAVTPEPRGEGPRGTGGRSFVVQKHAATRLHYDFRLELDGVLKSWAVPKGPSFDPRDKRLAMQTEDHPVEYGDFEGIIPEGEYGGGTVLLWDNGTWTPVGNPHQGFRSGALKFELHGRKLHGRWALVKIRGRSAREGGRSWLLVKDRDGAARSAAEYDVVRARPESVASGRSLEQIAESRDRVWHSDRSAAAGTGVGRARAAGKRPGRARTAVDPATMRGSRKARLPAAVRPTLATLVTEPPAGDGWLHEMKYDGYRILARVEEGRVLLLSRNGKDWTAGLPAVARACERLPVRQALLDGEVAVVLPDGSTSFQALQNAMGSGRDAEMVYFVFDLLHLDGYDLTRAALVERKAALKALLAGRARGLLRYSDHVAGSGREFFDEACRTSLEGIVSKRRDAIYEPGRARSWLKVKCVRRQEFVIGGFTEPAGARSGLGALLLGVYEDGGRLRYVGKVGTGFTARSLQGLRRRLDRLEQRSSPFAGTVRPAGRARWVRPDLVAEVAFTEWTRDGRLRHPSFEGLRADKPATDVRRETPTETAAIAATTASRRPPAGRRSPRAAPQRRPPRERSRSLARPARSAARRGSDTAEVAGVRLTHADRVLYPVQGISKRDLALHYEAIADRILPHVRGRPLTLVRCPAGAEKGCFYMKHSGVWAPKSLRRVRIREKTKTGEYLYVDSTAGLIGLVQMGILEIHTWNSVVERLEEPDRIVFDLDPGPEVAWESVVEAAAGVKGRLEDLGLESFLKTTGGVGLHVVVPLERGHSWAECLDFSRAVARAMAGDRPREYTIHLPKAGRRDKVLIDYLRNNRGSTSVAAYSTRALPRGPVSVPVAWDELSADLRSDRYDVTTLPRRLASLRRDPWERYWTLRQTITPEMRRAVGLAVSSSRAAGRDAASRGPRGGGRRRPGHGRNDG